MLGWNLHGNTSQKNLPRCIPFEQQTPPADRDGEQQSHGALIWRAVATLPTPLAILLLLAMRFPLSLATTKRQGSTDVQVRVPRVRNSLIILYNIVQIY